MTYNAMARHVDYNIALDVMGEYLTEAKSLVTHQFDSGYAIVAFDAATSKKTQSLKVHFNLTTV